MNVTPFTRHLKRHWSAMALHARALFVRGLELAPGALAEQFFKHASFASDDATWEDWADGQGAMAMQDAMASGRYAAVVFMDVSFHFDAFEEALGPALVQFASAGGALCFITGEGLQLCRVLKRIFNVPWEPSSYYRTTWTLDADAGDGGDFASAEVNSFSAKACSLAKVPPGERFYGTTPDSQTQSMVPTMHGRQVGERRDPESVLDDEDHDVCVAVRHVGNGGAVAYFGDVNCESATVKLVEAFLKRRTQRSDVLTAAEFEQVVEEKARGNALISSGDPTGAAEAYQQALGVYGERAGASGDQADERVAVGSNLAEAMLRLERWAEAEKAARDVLHFRPGHAKSTLRLARALHGRSDASAAKEVLRNSSELDGNAAARALLREVNATLRAQRGAFSSGFASAIGRDADAGESTSQAVGEAAAWASGLRTAERYEWLVDCYRMRVDDDYALGGCNLHGLYAKSAGDPGNTITRDFLLFCVLCKRRGVCDGLQNWSWSTLLDMAVGLLPYAFEKSDANEKYGGENVFSAAMGGRSLRFTGELVYGTGVMGADVEDPLTDELREKTYDRLTAEALCEEVGGKEAWLRLATALGEGWFDEDDGWSDEGDDDDDEDWSDEGEY